jgi:protein TonB
MRTMALGERAQSFEMHLDVANPQPLPRQTQALAVHGVASGFFGHVPASTKPIRRMAPEEARDIFLRGTLDRPMEQGHRNPLDWMVSLAIHTAVVTAVIVIPLLFTQTLDLHTMQVTFLSIPKPPAAAPGPPPPMIHASPKPVRNFSTTALTAPTAIPRQTYVGKGEEQAPDIEGGVIGGIPGGVAGGTLGGILGGTGSGPAAPQISVSRSLAKGTVLRVGGDVKPPRLILRIEPEYPVLARTAKIEGVVVIDATIDEHGDIVQAHAISGPGLLIPSALEAVLQWKYEPTYLNGEAVPVGMNVQVSYRLHG